MSVPTKLFLATVLALGAQADPYASMDGMNVLSVKGGDQQTYAKLEGAKCTMLSDTPAPTMYTICPPSAVKQLKTEMKGLKVEQTDAGAYYRNKAQKAVRPQARGAEAFFTEFQDLDAINGRVQELVDGSGGAAQMKTIGTTHEGREIKAVYLTGRDWVAGGPRAVYTFNIHAREWLSGMTGVYSLTQFLEMIKADDELMRDVEVVLVPMSNPDGFAWSHSDFRMWRKNRNPNPGRECMGVDLNRNWAVDWAGPGSTSKSTCSDVYYGTGSHSEPETQALDSIFKEGPVDLHVDMHAFSQLILGAWGYADVDHPRLDEINAVMAEMAAGIKSVHNETYVPSVGCGGLYCASGTFNDWSTGQGALGLTYELRPADGGLDGFAPDPDQILPAAQEAFEGLKIGVAQAKAVVAKGPRPVVPTPPPGQSECAPGCLNNWKGDGMCDAACNVAACDFDANADKTMQDCFECSPGCLNSTLGDFMCQEECLVEACDFDMKDCECTSLIVKNGEPWVDSDGDPCSVYSRYCTPDGNGADWIPAYAVDNITALDGCCECGGGQPTTFEDLQYDRHDHVLFPGTHDLFVIESTKKVCLQKCLAHGQCTGVDYGHGVCYGKLESVTEMGARLVSSENFFHFEKK